jgi:hypothetical protein
MKFTIYLLSAVAVLCSAGCTTDDGTSLALTASKSKAWVADVPVPSQFSLVTDRSRHWSNGELRWVDHLYAGKGSDQALITFYERQMPMHRWVLQNHELMQGEAILNYIKDQERCRIVIRGGNMFEKTYVKVAITPFRLARPQQQ